jgi:hypothetical protein
MGIGKMEWMALACLGLAPGGLFAHLEPGSLKPTGGLAYTAGETVTVTWGVEVAHQEGIEVALSVDGGKTWKTIRSTGDEGKTGAYRWTVPATPSKQAKLRICQTQNSPKCTDADNASRPSGPAPYVLVSDVFAIQAASAIAIGPHAQARAVAVPGAGYRGHDLRGRWMVSRAGSP